MTKNKKAVHHGRINHEKPKHSQSFCAGAQNHAGLYARNDAIIFFNERCLTTRYRENSPSPPPTLVLQERIGGVYP
jgi:hypothetical protein